MLRRELNPVPGQGEERYARPFMWTQLRRFGGTPYILAGRGNAFDLWNAGNPLDTFLVRSDAGKPTMQEPADWDFHQRSLAVLDDEADMFAAYYSLGSYALRFDSAISPSDATIVREYPFASQEVFENFITRVASFRDAQGKRYLVGRYLLQESQATGIYDFTDPANITRVRSLPLGTDPAAQYSQSFVTVRASGKPWVVMVAGAPAGGLHLLDVSNVAAIAVQTVKPSSPYSEYDQVTALAFDPMREQLAAAYARNGQPPLVVIWGIQAGVAFEVVRGTLPQLTRVAGLALNDGLVAASGVVTGSAPETRTTYLSSFGTGTTGLAWSTHSLLSIPSVWAFGGKSYQVTLGNNILLPVGGDLLLYRSGIDVAEWWRVPLGLLDPSPHASFTVTGGSAAATCAGVPTTPSQSNAAAGFPGDTFTILDTSYGELTGSELTVEPAASGIAAVSGGWHWTPPASTAPGEYRLTVTVSGAEGSDSLTRSVWLCSGTAALAIAPDLAGYLVGEQATLSAAGTQGHPSSFDFVLPAGVTASGSATGVAPPGTLGVTFASCGTFAVRTVARYAHAGADTGCGAWYADTRPGLHDACAELPSRLVAPARSSFLVKQNGTVTAEPLVSVETVLEFTGKVAEGYTPTLSWSYPGVSGCQLANAAGGYTGSTCRIPAGTMTAGQPVGLTLTVQLSPTPPGGCAGSITSGTTTVTPRSVTAGFQPSATSVIVGTNLSLVLENLSGTFSSLRYELGGGQTCAGQSSILIPSIFGGYQNGDTVIVQLATTGTRTITLYGTPAGGAELFLDSHDVAVALPAAPVLSAPTGAAGGESYTVGWTATSPGNSYELEEATALSFIDANAVTVSGTGVQIAHAPTATTTYYTRVRALAACGAVNYPSAWSNVGQTVVTGSTVEVTEQTVLTSATIEASDQILAGPGLVVTAPGHLVLRAGNRVVLRNGVTVGPGARMTIALGPS